MKYINISKCFNFKEVLYFIKFIMNRYTKYTMKANPKIIIHRANDRGSMKIDWLDTHYSFSFNNYYDPKKMGFGKLRVLNDDTISAGKGFGSHGHDNMEIITIILSGSLQHKDSMGHTENINIGEVQVMSAGSGIVHSEYNASKTQACSLLQIWITPKQSNIEPRYDQKKFDFKQDHVTEIVNGEKDVDMKKILYINQNAKLSIAHFKKGKNISYELQERNGAYIFVIGGKIAVGENILEKRDAIGVSDLKNLDIQFVDNSQILIIEIPMD